MREVDLRTLLRLKTGDEKVKFIQNKYIKRFVERYEEHDWKDARNHWEAMLKTPERLGVFLGIHVAVIIDEFQDMKFYIYDQDEKTLDDFKEINRGKPSFRAVDLTATYDRQSQSRRAPMLVSGSAVTMVFQTVMGGPLGGRFDFRYLKPFSIEDGATLAKKLLGFRNISITDELAIYLSSQVTGHPYYIYCCAESLCPEKSFDTREGIDRIIEFEITRGKIFGFWETHFAENRQCINEDNDSQLGKKIIYYFTRYNNAPVDIDEIAKKLKVDRTAVEAKIEKLYLADLVYRSDFKYYTFNDICLMRYIQHRYEKEIEGIEKIDLREKGIHNYLKGKFLEMVVQNIMAKFNNEKLDGALFGHPGEVIVAPPLRVAGEITVKLPNSEEYQIDAFGMYYDKTKAKHIWIAECKYRKNEPIDSEEIKRVLKAKEVVRETREATDVTVWLVSTGGFTKDALGLAREGGCLFSGQDEINEVARTYGVGVKIIPLD